MVSTDGTDVEQFVENNMSCTRTLTSIVGTVVIVTSNTMSHNMAFLTIHLFLSKRASLFPYPGWNPPCHLRLLHEKNYIISLLRVATRVEHMAYDRRILLSGQN